MIVVLYVMTAIRKHLGDVRIRVIMAKSDELECKITVLRDIIRRAQWHLGVDVQSSAPTRSETEQFLAEVRAVLKGD